MATPEIKCASHLTKALTPETLRWLVPQIVKKLSAYEFDAIACRGLSGVLVAPMVALAMNKTLLIIRNHLDCHSAHMVEGDYGARRYVILDDFASSGNTVEKIVKEISVEIPEARCLGLCEYLWMQENCSFDPELRSIREILYHRARPLCTYAADAELTGVTR